MEQQQEQYPVLDGAESKRAYVFKRRLPKQARMVLLDPVYQSYPYYYYVVRLNF
jgi:hypothetical protein